ncbi:glycosyltransferase family 2 protein [Aerosakkonema funiforme]|uniref:glycosyltransferase family 2 protein n=1 Tax=Aerosakkonema funiforme TaxID=1246630 RepID=UPI0035BB09EF
MKDKPLVSILINNHNYAHFLPDAIDSALKQTYPHTEVIVVDDGSTDNSREIIASYGDKIIPLLKPNGGQVSAFNAGFAASRGDIICFLDADDLYLPEKVAEVVNALGDREDLGWCFDRLKFVDVNLKDITGNKSIPENYAGTVQEYDLREKTRQGKPGKNFPYSSTSGISARRSLLQQILPIPEKDQSTLLNETFLIFPSLFLSKGVVVYKELGFYRIHGNNANATTKDKLRPARISILHAYWIREKFPSLYNYTNCLMGAGIGVCQANGGIEAQYQPLVQSYLSSVTLPEKLEIYVRAGLNFVKSKVLDTTSRSA